MTTSVERQGATTKNYWNDSGSSAYRASDSGSAIRINGNGLLNNTLTCEDPYRLDACSCWQPATITLEEDFANQIAAQLAKKISAQKDPLEKNSDVDEVEIPPMSGFIEI